MLNIKPDVWAAPEGSNYLASARLTLNDAFVISGIHIRDGKYGRYITMPSKLMVNDGKKSFVDICYPWSASAKKGVTEILLKAYDALVSGKPIREDNSDKPKISDESPVPGGIPFEVAVTPINSTSGLLADISINFDRSFVIEGVKLRQSWDKKNTYLTMPSYANSKGEWKNYCYAITPELQTALKEGCIAAYKAEMEKINPTQSPKTI